MARRSLCLCACCAVSIIFYFHESIGAVKPAAARPIKKDSAARRTDAQTARPEAIPKQRVVKDFKTDYKPEDATTVSVTYAGKVRKFPLKKNNIEVPYQTHQVALVTRLSCGLKMRDIWEVYYYRLETEWVFDGIEQIKSAPLNKPTSHMPGLDQGIAIKLITEAVEKKYGVKVKAVTVQSMKGGWKLCTPEYLATVKIVAAATDEVYKTTKTYECLFTSTLARAAKSWEVADHGCVYRGKTVADCHIGTMCRETGSESTVPAISDEEAFKLLRLALETNYSLRKNNIVIEKFELVKRLTTENYGMRIPCLIATEFVIDEKREIPGTEGGSPAPTYVPVRGVYECFASGNLTYSQREKKWEGSVDTCCAAGDPDCGWSCSTPYKGCRRLGEK